MADQEDEDIDYDDSSKAKMKPHNYQTTNEVECTGFFDDYLYRQTAWSGLLFFFSLLSVGRMFHRAAEPYCVYEDDDEDNQAVSVGFLLCGLGLVAILISSLVVVVLSVMKRRMAGFILFVVLLVGSVIYIIGSWVIAAEIPYVYCEVGGAGSILGGYACIYFGECFFIASMSILLGLDLWQDKWLNQFRLRMILTLSLTAFSSLITFLGYAILSNYLYKENLIETRRYAENLALTASGWFLIFVCMLVYLVVLLQIKKTLAYLICSVILLVAVFLCACGYWALNARGEDFDNAYFVGYSFYLLGFGVVLSVDMSFGQYIKQFMKR